MVTTVKNGLFNLKTSSRKAEYELFQVKIYKHNLVALKRRKYVWEEKEVLQLLTKYLGEPEGFIV